MNKFATLFSLWAALARSQSPPQSIPFDLGPGVASDETSTADNYIWPYHVYKSSPLNPPVLQVNKTKNASLAPGLIFLTISDATTTENITKLQSPQIFADDGRFVWAAPQPENITTTNLKWQMFQGKPTLTYWVGMGTSGTNIGHGYGNITFLNDNYTVTNVLCPKLGFNQAGGSYGDCDADLHESFIVSDRNTILLSGYNATPTDLTSVGGSKKGWIFDSQFRELDPISGKVLFEWSSIEHVPVNASHLPRGSAGTPTDPYDYFHINSVVNVGDYYLVNGRHTWTTYLVDKQGSVVWRFAGDTGGDFGPLPDNGHFRWQHFARPHNVTNSSIEISYFNNNNDAPTDPMPTDLLLYRLPLRPEPVSNVSQATLISNFHTKNDLYSQSQGSYFPDLSNGNHFAVYGQLPIMKEFDPSGDVVWSARIAPDNVAQVYRGYKQEWHATPATKPDFVVESGNSSSEYLGYASWNGATDVDKWNVYAGEQKSGLSLLGSVPFRGFETQFNLPTNAKYFQVAAVENGSEVKRSQVVQASSG